MPRAISVGFGLPAGATTRTVSPAFRAGGFTASPAACAVSPRAPLSRVPPAAATPPARTPRRENASGRMDSAARSIDTVFLLLTDGSGVAVRVHRGDRRWPGQGDRVVNCTIQ